MHRKVFYSALFILFIFLVSCSNTDTVKSVENQIPNTGKTENNTSELQGQQNITEQIDCPGPNINKIGESIAEGYQTVEYEDVMRWFCNGAEFEDILLALETAERSDNEVEDLLIMLVDGFTWEDIWLMIDFNE